MKKLLSILVLSFAVICVPVVQTGCTNPSARVVQVQTLKAVGHTAEASVALSAQLYRDGRITPKQANDVIEFYNYKFRPPFSLAVNAVQANLDSIASPELLNLAAELSALVASYQNSK